MLQWKAQQLSFGRGNSRTHVNSVTCKKTRVTLLPNRAAMSKHRHFSIVQTFISLVYLLKELAMLRRQVNMQLIAFELKIARGYVDSFQKLLCTTCFFIKSLVLLWDKLCQVALFYRCFILFPESSNKLLLLCLVFLEVFYEKNGPLRYIFILTQKCWKHFFPWITFTTDIFEVLKGNSGDEWGNQNWYCWHGQYVFGDVSCLVFLRSQF